MELPNLPDWEIQVEEVSAGVYNLRAFHTSGFSIGLKCAETEIVACVHALEDEVEKFKRSS
jgi:hypothetical protein